jgi:3-dehydroquinate synthetase
MVLTTLNDREFRSGLAEAVKHGLIADAEHLGWIEASAAQLTGRDLGAVTALIRRSMGIKAEIVARDEREAGPRELLNAGHTVGHALEHAGGYQLLHGEAVAIGLVAECRIGEGLGVTPAGTADRVAAVLGALRLPVRTPAGVEFSPSDLLAAMGRDKKNRGGKLRMALPTAIGQGASVDVPPNAVRALDL